MWSPPACKPAGAMWHELGRRSDQRRHHASDAEGKLGQISTEFIPGPDYGEGCKYSLFEQSIACVEWMRATWEEIREVA